MNLNSFLDRARSARAQPTLYWLGKGGWTHAEQAAGRVPDRPGRAIDRQVELEQLRVKRPAVHAEYVKEMAAAHLDMDDLPSIACDCSGFVCWALGVARDSGPWPGGWISTDTMHGDAAGEQRLFVPAARPLPGMLIVYPKPVGSDADGPPGHVGIVTAVSPEGRVTQVLHCAPRNFLLQSQEGLPRTAIAETGPELFDADPRTRVVSWRGFDRP